MPSSDAHHRQRVAYRQARLQRSLSLLRAHPAVNSSAMSLPLINPDKLLLRPPLHLPPQSPRSALINSEFRNLVERELGVRPRPPAFRAVLDGYLAAGRAVVTTPRLTNPTFVRRISNGYPRIADRALVTKVVTPPLQCGPTPAARSKARQLHEKLRKTKEEVEKRRLLAKEKAKREREREREKEREKVEESLEDISTRMRKRRRGEEKLSEVPAKKSKSTELAAFRPTAESVRVTRSAAVRARKNAANATPSECCFCPDPDAFDSKEIDSELIGPFVNRKGQASLFVHFDCACWAPQVYTDPATGTLKRVYDEYCRGRQLRCSSCNERGATIGCYIQKCKRVFHYRCLQKARAYTVERFFAAFCSSHAHLGRKKSYKVLMEAATIADVSTAQRREDTTFGLDAPHSRYTLLRRRETEVIFSRKARISSHYDAADDAKVVFSHRRRQIVKKTEKLRKDDGIRVLRLSAIDVASGKLAFMTLAERAPEAKNMTAVQARAAIASRESTGLFLLRNLHGSPNWKPGDIRTVKSIPFRLENKPSDNSKGKEVSNGVSAAAGDAGSVSCTNDKTAEDPTTANVPSTTSNILSMSQKVGQTEEDGSSSKSVQLPQKRKRGRPRKHRHPNECGSSSENSSTKSKASGGESSKSEGEKSEGTPSKDQLASQPKRRGRPPKVRPDSHPANRKSAWKVFLDEELAKERRRRPEDSVADSLRNMARLWSEKTIKERNVYERKARKITAASKEDPTANRDRTNSGLTSDRRTDIGLFTHVNKRQKIVHTSDKPQKLRLVQKNREPSAPLPSKRSLGSSVEAPDWDSMFPTTLGANNEKETVSVAGAQQREAVRKPPPSFR